MITRANLPSRAVALLAVPLIVLASSGCSTLVGHSNAGIEVLERDVPAPVRTGSMTAKYIGWIASAPLVALMSPFAAIAWATPWVDLPTAVDIATAPSIGLGYLTEASVGFPLFGALFWLDDAREAATGTSPDGLEPAEGPVHPPRSCFVPWGFVVDHREARAPPRPPAPLPAATRDYYAVPDGATERLRAAIAAAPSPEALDPIVVRLEGDRNAAALELTLAPEPGGARPLVLMSPPTQGIFAARYLARRYARRGVHAAVIVPDEVILDPDLPPAELEEKMREAVVQARAAVAALAARPDVARGELHYLGISAGGIFGVVLMAVEPAIARAVLIFPGGDIPELIVESTETTVVAYREAWAARGKSPSAIAREVARVIRTEPVELARHADPGRVLLFLSHGDTRVPIRGGLAIERAMGHPETWVLAGDHQSSGLCFGFVLRETDAFLLGD